MNKKIVFNLILMFIIVLGILFFLIEYIFNDLEYINYFLEQKDLNSINIIYLEDFNLPEDITCTGFAFDEEDEKFWVIDNGLRKNSDNEIPKLFQIDLDELKVLKTIELEKNENNSNIQGITFDSSNNSIWLASEQKLFNINKSGDILRIINNSSILKNNYNGISYDKNNDVLHVLYLFKFYKIINKNGETIGKKYCNFKNQDQMYWYNNKEYITIGADYFGNNNYVACFSLDKFKIKKIYRLNDSYAIEGIVINDNKIYVLNDGYFHNSKISRNYIAIYNNIDDSL